MSITTFALSQYFVRVLTGAVVKHSRYSENPFEVTVSLPELIKLRIYFYYTEEHYLGESLTLCYLEKDAIRETCFDYNDVNFVMLIGYVHDEDVFIIWDASKHKDLEHSKKLKVDSSSIISAHMSHLGLTEVKTPFEKEIIISSKSDYLADALKKRIELTISELAGGDYEFA